MFNEECVIDKHVDKIVVILTLSDRKVASIFAFANIDRVTKTVSFEVFFNFRKRSITPPISLLTC